MHLRSHSMKNLRDSHPSGVSESTEHLPSPQKPTTPAPVQNPMETTDFRYVLEREMGEGIGMLMVSELVEKAISVANERYVHSRVIPFGVAKSIRDAFTIMEARLVSY